MRTIHRVVQRRRQGARRAAGRWRLGEAGQALVEVAIALPILLALLVVGRLLDAGIVTSTVTVTGVAGTTGNPVSVQISVPYKFTFIGPVLDMLSTGDNDPGTINLRSTSTMRKE